MKLFGLGGSALNETGETIGWKKLQWWHCAFPRARFQGMHKLCEKKLRSLLRPIFEGGFYLFSAGMNPVGNLGMQLGFEPSEGSVGTTKVFGEDAISFRYLFYLPDFHDIRIFVILDSQAVRVLLIYAAVLLIGRPASETLTEC